MSGVRGKVAEVKSENHGVKMARIFLFTEGHKKTEEKIPVVLAVRSPNGLWLVKC